IGHLFVAEDYDDQRGAYQDMSTERDGSLIGLPSGKTLRLHANAELALEDIRQTRAQRPKEGLLGITDLRMGPGMSGEQLIEEGRKVAGYSIPFIVASGSEYKGTKENVLVLNRKVTPKDWKDIIVP